MTQDDLRRLIKDELADIIELRHDLHRHPELLYQEHRTSMVVCDELKRLGIEHKGGLAHGTGVVAHLPATSAGSESSGAIGLRADMDALPIQERTGLPYASEHPGLMHACGHDGHTANLLGAARVLSKTPERKNPITFVFQPAEEGGAGAKAMCDSGALNGTVVGPPVQRMYGLHGWPQLKVGEVGTRAGPLMAATDSYRVTVKGVQSHGAYPHLGRDSIVATAHCITALQTLTSRNIGPVDSAVVTVGQINAGTAENIIPETCTIIGTIRSLTPTVRATLRDRFHDVVHNTARAFGCDAEIEYTTGYPVTLNDAALTERFFDTASSIFGKDRVIEVPQPSLGGEDFAYYGQHVPALFFILGVCPREQDDYPTLHQPDYDFNDDALATGMEAMCSLALGDA